ncbi:MAG: WD40-repeat-containing domain protein [Benniella sp.]|nr:MAG: WD40-repeat-containing domain protein [Benniella sp.]
MVFGSAVPSAGGPSMPQQFLDLANLYLEQAFGASDPDIALELCRHAEDSLSKAKKTAKKTAKNTRNQAMVQGIAYAYISLGKLLESRGFVDGARAILKKAEKLGGNIGNLGQPANNYRPSIIAQTLGETSHSAGGSRNNGAAGSSQLDQQQPNKIPAHIFAENIGPPKTEFRLPEPDERLNNTPQLVYCLGLLKAAQSADITFSPLAHDWLQIIGKNTDEKDRLHGMAADIIGVFKAEKIKDTKSIAEVVCLAPVLKKEKFLDLLREIYLGINHSGPLNIPQLEGLAQMIQGADHDHLSADHLIKILGLLNTHMMGTHQMSPHFMYQLTRAVSHVLDAMADTKVTDLDREKLHEPLSSYLSGLKESSDPFLVYQAAYAYQALLCVPDDETIWQAAMRRTRKVIRGLSGLVTATKALDLDKLIEGLENIQLGLAGASKVVGTIKTTYDGVTQNAGFMDSLKEGLSFGQKRDWYSALRGADALIQDGELATFRKLVCEAPCRYDPAFQWGVCQRLGEMAANLMWDAETRRSAIEFLGEMYKNDEMWGQHASVSQWILNILMQLCSKSGETLHLYSVVAETLLRELDSNGDTKKQVLYSECREKGPIAYPLNVALPEFASPSLIDRVQDRPDIERSIRVLRKQRTSDRYNAVYIPPQAKASLQAADDTHFPLMDKVKEFLASDQRVFLILGDSGAGKSTFTRELEFDLWQSYESNTGRIPLHINLPTINKPEHDMIAKKLRSGDFSEIQIREMKHRRKIILICDGYDECQQTHNLYMSNRLNQPGEWDVQMVICCRIEHLGSDYRDRFQPRNRNQLSDSPLFQQAVFTPFSIDQIQDYVEQYVSIYKTRWQVKDYMDALDLTPSLKDLVRNPFLMTLSLEVLPQMESEQRLPSARITRVALYDLFVEQWVERGKRRLAEKDMSPQAKAAFERLAAEGFTLNGIEYLKKLAVAIYKEQDGRPVVEYSQYKDEGSWKDDFFLGEDKQLLRETCPLSRNGDQHRFIHRSVLEYGLARAVFDPRDRKNRAAQGPALGRRVSMSSTMSIGVHDSDEKLLVMSELEPDPDSPLVWRSFVEDYSLLQFLEERVQQEPVFEEQLLAYIEHSKMDEKWCTVAANAMTILVRAGVQFIGIDLRGVRIPGADLSYGVFDSVQLQGANMRKVNLRGTWLRQTDLSEVDMAGVQFGELPYLTANGPVCSCAFSPDGKSLAVGLHNGYIQVYSTSNWDIIRVLNGHKNEVHIAYSPDGNMVVSGSLDKTVRLWITESGICQRVLTGHADKIHCVAYSPLENQVASASGDKTIRLWDPATGNCCQTLFGHDDEVGCVAYSPGGDQIASGSNDFTVRLWNAVTGECCHIFDSHSDMVWGVVFSPQGDQITSASKDRTIRLWDVESGNCRHILEGHSAGVTCVVYSPKGDRIFSTSTDGTVRVWDVQSGTCHDTLTGHTHHVFCLAYSPKGDMVASGSGDKIVRLWDVSAGGSRHISSGHGQEVGDVKCSPNGNMIASSSADTTIRLWDVETGSCLRTLSGHSNSVFGIAFSPQRNQIVSGSADNTIRLWDVDTGACQHILTGHTNTVWSITYSPLCNQVASASEDKTVRLWNAITGEHCGTLKSHTDGVMSVAYSPDGGLIATGSKDCTVRLWSVGTMTCINTLIGHSNWVNDVVFSPREGQLASASDDGTVRLWSTATGECCLTLTDHDGPVPKVAYSYKGDLFASCSWGKTARLWDTASGRCLAMVQNFQGRVNGVAWTPSYDTNYLVTGCQDGSVLKLQVEEEEGQYVVSPCWIATNGSLTVAGASIQGVRGLTPQNNRLLEQRGAVGESAITMASVVSQRQSPNDMKLYSASTTYRFSEKQPKANHQLENRMDRMVNSKSNVRRHHPYRRTT